MRGLALIAVAATALAPFAFDAAEAGRRPGRVVFETYSPVGINFLVLDFANPGVSLANVELEPKAGERTVSVELSDESGYVVRGSIAQGRKTIATFCGKTYYPIVIDPKQPVRVHVFTGTCGSSVGIASEGGVTATFR